MKQAYLALGSNMGDREGSIRTAIELIGHHSKIELGQVASLYYSKPQGDEAQGDYVNTVIEIRTTLAPEQLLEACLEIEKQLGRVRSYCWAPRTIDIDLIDYDNMEYQSDTLTLPHPRALERDFVLIPLREITLSGYCLAGRNIRDAILSLDSSFII